MGGAPRLERQRESAEARLWREMTHAFVVQALAGIAALDDGIDEQGSQADEQCDGESDAVVLLALRHMQRQARIQHKRVLRTRRPTKMELSMAEIGKSQPMPSMMTPFPASKN